MCFECKVRWGRAGAAKESVDETKGEREDQSERKVALLNQRQSYTIFSCLTGPVYLLPSALYCTGFPVTHIVVWTMGSALLLFLARLRSAVLGA